MTELIKEYLLEGLVAGLFAITSGALSMAVYLIRREINSKSDTLTGIEELITGNKSMLGLKTRIELIEERFDILANDHEQEIIELKAAVESIQRQIVENQLTLTKDLSAHAQKTDRQLGEIIGYLKAKGGDNG